MRNTRNSRGGRPRVLARVSSAEIQAELARRLARMPVLQKRHDELEAELERVRADIAALGGAADGAAGPGRGRRGRAGLRGAGGGAGGAGVRGRRRRATNKMTLVEALESVLKGKSMAVTDAAAAVKASGYKTKAKDFRTVVNIALINSGRFRRVGRGEYTAK